MIPSQPSSSSQTTPQQAAASGPPATVPPATRGPDAPPSPWPQRLADTLGLAAPLRLSNITVTLSVGYLLTLGLISIATLTLPEPFNLLGWLLLAFKASIALHELGHALAARISGLRVPRLHLGVHRSYVHVPDGPRADRGTVRFMALAGPALQTLAIAIFILFFPPLFQFLLVLMFLATMWNNLSSTESTPTDGYLLRHGKWPDGPDYILHPTILDAYRATFAPDTQPHPVKNRLARIGLAPWRWAY